MDLFAASSKIVNDPVFGLIGMPGGQAAGIVESPLFQRLRRIRQLGMTHYVYPGAEHTRLQHTLGCAHLMRLALETLRSKGVDVTPAEAEACQLAILLHDIGHAPFSHALERCLLEGVDHEAISAHVIAKLAREQGGALREAEQIFAGRHPKPFLHQLVSSQLDIDRLDYLRRDSFFTGVVEGVVSTERLIRMLNVAGDSLVVDQKGVYSVEKFLVARRLMYWQVYLHKTVIGVERTLRAALARAKELRRAGAAVPAPPALDPFLGDPLPLDDDTLALYAQTDDDEVMSALKLWARHPDPALSLLAGSVAGRRVFRVRVQSAPFDPAEVAALRRRAERRFGVDDAQARHLVATDTLSNSAYKPADEEIKILGKDGSVRSILEASDMFDHEVMSKTVLKHYLCYPKEIDS